MITTDRALTLRTNIIAHICYRRLRVLRISSGQVDVFGVIRNHIRDRQMYEPRE